MKKFVTMLVVLTVVVLAVSCGGKPDVKLATDTETKEPVTKIEETKEVIEKTEEVVEEKVEIVTEPIEDKPVVKETFVNKTAVFETNHGTFEIALWVDKAPIATGNMIDKINAGFYNNLIFHRIIDNFMIQGGDPQGTGMGGENMNVDPAFPGSSNIRGTIAMASSTTGQPMAYQSDAQFFISVVNNSFLDGSGFIAFGEVTSGMDIVDKLSKVQTGPNDAPVSPVTIVKAFIK